MGLNSGKTKERGEKVKCFVCDDLFRDSYNRWRHYLRKHLNKEPTVIKEKPKPTCSLCGQVFFKNGNLKRHYKSCKKFKPSYGDETHNFLSIHEFEEWKRTIEMETEAQFIKKSTYKLKNGSFRTQYNCHRSGYFRPQGQNKRCRKFLGSNKINAVCPAKIIAIVNHDNNVEVSFFSKHSGHNMELERTTLSKEDRAEIAEKIAKNIPYKDILSSMRNANDLKKKRLQLLKRKDLNNIARKFKVSNQVYSWPKKIAGKEEPSISATDASFENEQPPEELITTFDSPCLEEVPVNILPQAPSPQMDSLGNTQPIESIREDPLNSSVQEQLFVVDVPYSVNLDQQDVVNQDIHKSDDTTVDKLKEEIKKEFELVMSSVETKEQALNAKKWICSFHSFVNSVELPFQIIETGESIS